MDFGCWEVGFWFVEERDVGGEELGFAFLRIKGKRQTERDVGGEGLGFAFLTGNFQLPA